MLFSCDPSWGKTNYGFFLFVDTTDNYVESCIRLSAKYGFVSSQQQTIICSWGLTEKIVNIVLYFCISKYGISKNLKAQLLWAQLHVCWCSVLDNFSWNHFYFCTKILFLAIRLFFFYCKSVSRMWLLFLSFSICGCELLPPVSKCVGLSRSKWKQLLLVVFKIILFKIRHCECLLKNDWPSVYYASLISAGLSLSVSFYHATSLNIRQGTLLKCVG